MMHKHNSGYLWPLIGILAVVLLVWWAVGNQTTSMPGSADTSIKPTATKPSTGSSGTKPAAPKGTDVVSVAAGVSDASTFASWLTSTGVGAELTGAGPYTIFVPSDASIAQLPAGTFKNLSAADQKRFVRYHIVSGRMIDVSAQVSGSITSLSGDPLNFTKRTGQPALVGSGSILGTYKASNGIVYLVNSALLPPQKSR